MLQILQNIQNGEISLKAVPPPALLSSGVLVRTGASLISAGTEKMLIDLGRKNLLGKAKARPDLVRQIIAKAKTQGLLNTFHNVRSKMERPMPLGYSAAGIVEAVGAELTGLKIGDRVAIAGAGYANHAEVNHVPRNLIALIPDEVSFEEAAYTTVASIALQGVRLAKPELGDNVVVIGLGLIGLVAVQLLKANGCRVLGIDYDRAKVEKGLRLGMDSGVVLPGDNTIRAIDRFTRGRNADLTFITAATKSNQPIEMAGEITRRKGKVVAVGAVGLNIPRNVYYKKELDLKISMSYGPGRYDPSYEEGGIDYPYDYVRWTGQRNMAAILNLVAERRLDLRSLTTHRYKFDQALMAYELIKNGTEQYVGIVLEYDVQKPQDKAIYLRPYIKRQDKRTLGVGFVGAGNYSAVNLIPHLKKRSDVQFSGLVTATGLNAQQKAEKFGFAYCVTDVQVLLDDPAVDAVFIATRHGSHADFTVRALNAGKHVFVEKPMVVNQAQLDAVCDAFEGANAKRSTGLMVGLNRRFAPMVVRLKELLGGKNVKQMVYRVNSGPIPTTSWLHDPEEGGGMLVGEMCHFVDLMQFISGERPISVYARCLSVGNQMVADHDNVAIVVSYDGGSVGTLCYSTVGTKSAPKERLEVYGGGSVAVLDDFRVLQVTEGDKRNRMKSASQDKGQTRQVAATVEAFRTTGVAPIAFEELVEGMGVIFGAGKSLLSGEPVALSLYRPRQQMIA